MLYNILYNICNLLFIRLAVITHNWISLPCRQGTVEGKVWIGTANWLFFRSRNRQKLVRIRFENIRYLLTYLLTYSIVQSPSWEANWFAASQEIPLISWNPKVHYRTHKCPPPVPILGQHDPVHAPTSHFLKIHLNIILPSTPGSPNWFLSFTFPHQHPVYASPLPYTPYMPSPSQHHSVSPAYSVFRNVLRREVVSTSANPQARGPPLVGSPQLLIQYIRSYSPYRRPLFYPQPEDTPCRGDRDPLIMGMWSKKG